MKPASFFFFSPLLKSFGCNPTENRNLDSKLKASPSSNLVRGGVTFILVTQKRLCSPRFGNPRRDNRVYSKAGGGQRSLVRCALYGEISPDHLFFKRVSLFLLYPSLDSKATGDSLDLVYLWRFPWWAQTDLKPQLFVIGLWIRMALEK